MATAREIGRAKAEKLRKEMNATFGKEIIKKGTDPYFKVEYIPTGVIPIDDLLGGGLPRGRSIEIFGDYSTFKSYIGLSAIAHAQDLGLIAGLIDTEHAFDPEWAEALGVDVDALLLQYPSTGEEAVDATETMVQNDAGLIVWDSVAASLPKAEAEKSARDPQQPARLAQMMSLGMRKITTANAHTALLFINQTRVNVGVMFGSNEAVPGGKALPFYASQRVAIRKAGTTKGDRKVYDEDSMTMKTKKVNTAQKIRATLVKSKLNAPHRECMFSFDFDSNSLDISGYLIGQGLAAGVIRRPNNTMWEVSDPSGVQTFRGKDAIKDWVISDPKRVQAIIQGKTVTEPENPKPSDDPDLQDRKAKILKARKKRMTQENDE